MRKILFLSLFSIVGFSCTEKKEVQIAIQNDSSFDRSNEIVEVAMSSVAEKLQLNDTATFIIIDAQGQQVPYQITYDEKIIFPANVKSNTKSEYVIKPGTPEQFLTMTTGKQYPERVDDIAWENDKIAFRTYGPALQATGERAFGYDIWVKSVPELVVEDRYAGELNPETKAKIAELKKTDPKAADELYKSVSYHVDHGNGLDCYKVGPTLGGGTAALMVNDSILYPYCYKSFEILDNGPLRFTVKLEYNPLTVKGESDIVETRIISLDAGTQLNKTTVSYSNLKENTPIVAGIVLHEPADVCRYVASADKGYIGYADPTDNVDNNNGIIYVGAVFPQALNDAKPVFYSEKEKTNERGGADGQLLAISEYTPGSDFVYYWGAGWSKYGFDTPESWFSYLEQAAAAIQQPLSVTLVK